MALNDQNTYLILTKRPQYMFEHVLISEWRGSMNHVWHGLTVCNQQELDEKIPIFLQVPGKKFLSIEPMLGPVEINFLHLTGYSVPDMYDGQGRKFPAKTYDGIDAVILGGETGPGARPLHPNWVRSIKDQCADAGVDFFFKQWGEWAPSRYEIVEGCVNHTNGHYHYEFDPTCEGAWQKLGRKKSGRLLDGRTHDDLPWVKS